MLDFPQPRYPMSVMTMLSVFSSQLRAFLNPNLDRNLNRFVFQPSFMPDLFGEGKVDEDYD